MLVGFRADRGPKTPEARANTVRQGGGSIHKSLRIVPVVSATLPEQAIQKLKARSDVEYIEEDVVLYALAQTLSWGVDRIDADLAWPAGNTGKGVKVAILDTGIDYDHPDLVIAGGVNFVGTRDGSTAPSDWNDNHGHGTHCAGIVAARNNTIGVVGVAPDAALYAVKVLSDNGSGYTSDIIQGLDWCVANGIKVVSMSLGGTGTTSMKAACDRAYASGVLLVAAAGNSAGAVMYPAAYTSVIAVSATTSQNQRASFSNYGPQIELAAPGVSIHSTYKNGGYAYMSGTSMACPHVAGAAVLAWASGLSSNTAVRQRLRSTAEDLGAAGLDTSFGYGLVDAQKAAGAASTPTTDNPPSVDITAPSQGSTVSGVVAVKAAASDDKGVTRVEFLVDGARIGLDAQSSDGWSVSWSSAAVADGQHTITAKATDTAGKTASDAVTVTVGNTDASPTIRITNPQKGATISGAVTITAAAGDDKGVAGVKFTIDGGSAVVDTDGTNGWSAQWNTAAFANGLHTLAAVATDTKGQTSGHSITVTVSNNSASAQGKTASVGSITYKTAGGYPNNLDLYITIQVEDDLGNPLYGASCMPAIYLNGRIYRAMSGRTNASGSATLRIASAPSGTYQTRISSLTATGLTWDGVTPDNGFTK
ncbi:MAG: S8 family serine peptidase [Solirubrobacterales bacterium]